jgi:ribosomal protein S18 acetylase RimI-like enzyme
MRPVTIVRAGVDRVRDLEAVSRAMHRHHVAVDPQIPGIPPRDEDAWWSVRSGYYLEWLGGGEAFALIAEDEGRPVGYAVVTFHGKDDSHATGERFAELQSLAVLEEERGAGIGTALLHEVYRQVRAAGVEEMVIGVLATNEPAMRLYEREGFRPWVVLTMGKVPDPDIGS